MRRNPKPYLESSVRSAVPIFTKLCSLARHPIVTFSRSEVSQLGLKRSSNLYKWLGMSWSKEMVIWINPRLATVEDARKTLAHEFIHLRFPYLAHTAKFWELESRLLKGEQFKPHRKKETTLVA